MNNMPSFWNRIFFLKPKQLPVFKITMLGPSGSGKTSLLAAMYDQFESISKDLQLIADDKTKPIINERLQDLKSMVGDTIIARGGLEGTVNPRSYKFELGEIGAEPSICLHFQDYPGEYGIDTPDKQEEIRNFIRESVAIVIGIDAAALMEKGGIYHETLNQPTRLTDWFTTVYQDLETPRLVILAPVKCEKYIKEQRDLELLERVKLGYKQLLDRLASDNLLGKVAVAITPVETVGSVFFSRIEETEKKEPIFYYRKFDPNDGYEPKNSEQPLKYILRFIGEVYCLGRKNSLNHTVRNFDNPNLEVTKIVQGQELLNIGR